MNRYAQQFVAAGRLHTVRGWLEAVGQDAVVGYPPLAVAAAWMLPLNGDAAGARRFLHAAECGSFDGPLLDGSSSLTFATTLVRATMGALGVDRMLLDASTATALEPPGSPWLPTAMATLGIAHALTGDGDLAVKELDLAARLGHETKRPAAAVGALGELSLLAAERGDWLAAEDKAGQAVDLTEATGIEEHLFTILGHAAAARVAAHDGHQVAARRHVGRTLRLYATPSTAAFPWLSAHVAITLGQIFLDLGDHAAARFRAQEARRHLAGLLTEGVLRSNWIGCRPTSPARAATAASRAPWR